MTRFMNASRLIAALSRMRRLSLMWNAFAEVPPALRCATALQELDLRKQTEQGGMTEHEGDAGFSLSRIDRLLTLCDLPQLRRVNLGLGSYPDLPVLQTQRPDILMFTA